MLLPIQIIIALWAITCAPVILDLLLSNIAPRPGKSVTSPKFEFAINYGINGNINLQRTRTLLISTLSLACLEIR